MELRELTYFVAVAEELHFGRAAERLHIAQPAVSQQVARLERELGVRLLDRSSRTVRLTGAGEVLLGQARRVLAEVDAVRGLAADLVRGDRGVLRVGVSEDMGWRLQQTLVAFGEARPGVRVAVSTAHTPVKLDGLRHRDLDLAFVRSVEAGPQIRLLPLWREPLFAALPERHPLAALPAVPLAALADLPVALTPRADNPAIHDLFLGLCRRAGFEPVLAPAHHSTTDTLANIAGSADTWFPVHAAHNAVLENGQAVGVAIRPFADLDVAAMCSLAWPAVDPDPAAVAFVEVATRLRDEGVFTAPAAPTSLGDPRR